MTTLSAVVRFFRWLQKHLMNGFHILYPEIKERKKKSALNMARYSVQPLAPIYQSALLYVT